jgi:P-type Ca2+ transporter type 2C
LFVTGNRLVIDESPLTGESLPVKKSATSPYLFSGCQVSEGSGRMLVTAVGTRSSGGQIQELLNEAQSEETVLQQKLKIVAVLIGKVGFASGLATFIGLTIRLVIIWVQGTPASIHGCGAQGTTYTTSTMGYVQVMAINFVIGLTVVVVAVPEGLPLAVTISLAFSMFKMMKDNCFVRHLDAAETMGEATCICTDKTGTLTENRMTVVRVMIGDKKYNGSGSGSGDGTTDEFSVATFDDRARDILTEGICVNSDCFLKKSENGLDLFIGSATEGALLVFARKLNVSYDQVRKDVSRVDNGVWSFSSERKRMSTLVIPRCKAPQSATKYRLYSKGASEIILKRCKFVLDPTGTAVNPLNQEQFNQISKIITKWAGDGLRTIGLAFKNMDQAITTLDTDNGVPEPDNDNLIWVGLVGIKDPVRKEVPGAVRICQRAGITVRMVTGDNLLTACKIAEECGIMFGDGIAIEGPVFRAMTRQQKIDIIPKLQVVARSSPSDKHTLVSLLKDLGEVVAVTGDGTNDAPALKEADVGFAMGIAGTQIARNACDIVLLDDNFVSLVSSIRWGRNVLNSIRKFLQFQLGVNLVAITITFLGSISYGKSPLSTVQLLWVNLIMDTFGALALATDDPDDDILLQPPHSRNASLLSTRMIIYILNQFFYQISSLLIIMFGNTTLFPAYGYDADVLDGALSVRTTTMVFTVFIFCQITNEIMARQLNGELNPFENFFRNKIFLIILVIIIAIQLLGIYVGSSILSTTTLNGRDWGICLGFAGGNMVFTFFVRLVSKFVLKDKSHAHSISPEYDSENSLNNKSSAIDIDNEKTEVVPIAAIVPAPVVQKKKSEMKVDARTHWKTLKASTVLIGHYKEVKSPDHERKEKPTEDFMAAYMRFRKERAYLPTKMSSMSQSLASLKAKN